jgi:hypothetical protein
MKFQESRTAQDKYAKAKPAWFDMARAVMKKINDGERQHIHAIAEAMEAAHAMGVAGEPPKEDPEMAHFRKTGHTLSYRAQGEPKPAAQEPEDDEPAPAPTRIRRSRG